MLEIKSTKLEVDDFSSIKLARSDDTPFNQPGRKAATNRYVNTMLSMLDSSEAAKVINRAINSIYLNPSQVQKVAFFQQLKDPHGFLSGPAYSVIRQEVFDAYEGDFDSFLTDFNLIFTSQEGF